MDSLAGRLLIASPQILDPNFRRTVVFITAHTEDGAVGLILNRPSETTVGDAVPQLASVIDSSEPVFVGGPVNPNGVAMLAEFEDPDDAGVWVADDIGFVALDDALEEGPPPLGRMRVFAGVAGWGEDQLEGELERNDWFIEPADANDVFTEDAEDLWSSVLRRKGGEYELVARMPHDPSLN
jgi:putative transcriptional regulator